MIGTSRSFVRIFGRPRNASSTSYWLATDVLFDRSSNFANRVDFLEYVFGHPPTKHILQAFGNIQSFERIKSQVNDIGINGDVFGAILPDFFNEMNYCVDNDG